MTKLEFEKVLIPLIEYIDDIEMDLITNILDRIDNYDGVKGSLEWYTDKLSELKLLDKDNLKVFKKDKKKLKKIITQLAEDCGYHIDNIDKLNEYYKQGLLNNNPMDLYDNIAINRLIKGAIKETNNIMDLIQTKAIEGSNKAYKDILNQAYVETASGTYTYTESIRKALDKFAEQGIKAVHYKNGKSLSIESVTRRDVITRMNKLNGDIEIENAKALGTNLVYVDQHLGARVRTKYTKEDYEVHAEWQGKKYMIEGSNDKYDNLYEKTGYGEMLGLKGINCYHNMRPTWEWEEIDEQIDLKENARVRAILDKRNYYARKLRTLKHKRLNSKVLEDKEEYKKINKQFKSLSDEYNSWLKDNNLTRDYNREYISNKKEIKPQYEMYNHKKEYTLEEEKRLFKDINNKLNKEIDIESKWSGKININNDCSPCKEWDCSITIGSSTLEQEIQHELLHARSISYYDRDEYLKYQSEEEATVEFLNKQLLEKEKIPYYDNAYINMVNKLEEISGIINIDKFDFAMKLFKTRPKNRRKLIIDLAMNNNKKDVILNLLEEAYPKW